MGASPGGCSARIVLQVATHWSQMKTCGPAMRRWTCSSVLPQKEQVRLSFMLLLQTEMKLGPVSDQSGDKARHPRRGLGMLLTHSGGKQVRNLAVQQAPDLVLDNPWRRLRKHNAGYMFRCPTLGTAVQTGL